MTLKEIIDQQEAKGITIPRLAKVFECSAQALYDHKDGTAKKVNIKLAKTIYKKFNIVLDGFLELELKED
jgi:hypothetical protein